LQTVPSALLLLLKTNDLMRVINHDLGMNSLNVFSTTVRYCLRSINEDRWRMHKGLRTWFRNTFTTLVLNVKLALLGWSMWLSSFMLTDE
jgi:pyruvate/oxaloacetate carboxyltransferase